jgi:hypothetical protein
MFNWFRQRRIESRRRIFKFWNGRREQRIDPIVAFFGLQAHPTFNAAVHCKLVDVGDREASVITSQAVRDVFGVDAYDPVTGCGLTIGEQLGLLASFFDYIDDQKKSGPTSPTSSLNTEEPTSWPSENVVTTSTSDSGPAVTAATPDAPTPPASP